MLVNFTGVYLAFPQQISAAVNTVWPGRDMRAAMFQARVEPMRGVQPMSVNEAVELARSKVPEGRFLDAFLSIRPDQAMRIGLIRADHIEGAPIVTVIIDPFRKSVVDVFDPRTMTTGERIVAWQRALHYGIGLGGGYSSWCSCRGDHPGVRHHGLPHVVDQTPQPSRRRACQAAIQAGAAARAAD